MEELISVIIPVYNVEKYLERCIVSIINQSYKNLEIILVNDGSTDNSPVICDEYAHNDKRIKVIHKKNGGLSDARNTGIKICQGNYICFADSDDYISIDMIKNLYSSIKDTQLKMAICNLKAIDDEGNDLIESKNSPIKDGVFTANELLPKIYQELGWYYIVAWNKLYHRSLFDNIEFPYGKIHEDEYVIAQLMIEAQKISCISNEEYMYVYQRNGSIMSKKNANEQYDWLEALYLRFQYCNGKELEDFVRETRAVYFRELNNLFLKEEYKDTLNKSIKRKAKRNYSNMDGKSLTEKVNWVLFNISPSLESYLVKKVRSR